MSTPPPASRGGPSPGSRPASLPPHPGTVKPILLAACGNLLAGDDAFGPWVLRAVEALWPPEAAIRRDVEIVDLSIAPAGLLDYLPERFGLVLIDAVQGDMGREALVDTSCAEMDTLVLESPHSSHGMGLAWQLRLAGQLSLMPRHARLIALPIAGARVGGRVSAGALELVPAAARLAARWCHAYAALWQTRQGVATAV